MIYLWYIGILIYFFVVMRVAKSTTVRVSKNTLGMLERLREKMQVGTLDEAIRLLIRRQRKMLIDEAFGLDRRRIKPFSEEDRGEDRS